MPPGSQCLLQARWLSSVPLQKSSLAFPTPGSSTRVQKLCASVLTPVGCRVIQSMPELSPAQSLSPGQRSLCSWLCSGQFCTAAPRPKLGPVLLLTHMAASRRDCTNK